MIGTAGDTAGHRREHQQSPSQHSEQEACPPSVEDERYGDDPYRNIDDETVFTILALNCQGIPVDRDKQESKRKMTALFNFIMSIKPDVIGLNEVNICWKNVTQGDRMRERIFEWFKSVHICNSYNYQAHTPNRYLRGGTSTWSIDAACHRVYKSGRDTSGLGRWSWVAYRGRNDIKIKIYTVYFPGSAGEGPDTTYNQHQSYFSEMKQDRNPIAACWEDLQESLDQSHDEGFTLICMGDFNRDIRDEQVTQYFSRWDMRDIIIAQRPDLGTLAPPDHACD